MEIDSLEAQIKNIAINFLIHPVVFGIPGVADQEIFYVVLNTSVNYVICPYVLIVHSGLSSNIFHQYKY